MNELTAEAPGFLLGELNAYQTGQFLGHVAIWIALLAGAAKCWSISRRPTTNAKCVRALMLVLLAFVGCSAVGTLPRPGSASPALAAAVGLLSLGAVGSIIAAIVLAILGLMEQARQPGRFVQGRSQAIWALSLVGFVGLLMLFGAVQGATRTRNLTTAPDQPRPGQFLRFDELNFQFRTPDRPWVAADAAKFNKQSQVAFIRHFPESYFLIIAERFGASGEV
ncbi:MAG TPA: hypothetical protein VNT26_21200, partial [Candidatus Sulfotelmatobacter sp.]|nr:hypothetical protein [Candidatus Sulfotelmatobacter sp.]